VNLVNSERRSTSPTPHTWEPLGGCEVRAWRWNRDD